MFTMAGTGDLILPVPEPANEALIGLALLAVIGCRGPAFARLGTAAREREVGTGDSLVGRF